VEGVNYYNDNDPFCCAWLKELMADGLIPKGDIDERSIADVVPSDLDGYVQCHFFAGIGGWPYALRLAGWPGDRRVWTGSCPCQPFSVAGKGAGIGDERHLWPAFRWLVAQCRPPVVFGEQVASKDGRIWLSGVRSDLEALDYAVGAADLCAAGIGAPHERQRLFWVANAENTDGGRTGGKNDGRRREEKTGRSGLNGRLADPEAIGREEPWEKPRRTSEPSGGTRRLEFPEGERCGKEGHGFGRSEERPCEPSEHGRLADNENDGCEHGSKNSHFKCDQRQGGNAVTGIGFWDASVWWPCADGKFRRIPARKDKLEGSPGTFYPTEKSILQIKDVEPALFPLAYGFSGRVGILRGAGNAIVPQEAAEFIKAAMESTE